MSKINGKDTKYNALTNFNELHDVNKSNVLLKDLNYTKTLEKYEETTSVVSFIDDAVDNGPKFIDVYTLKSGANWSISSHNLLTNDAATFSEFSASSLWDSFQSLFFSSDDSDTIIGDRSTITHPWKFNTSISAVHCIHLSNELYNDYLSGFSNDLIFSVTGILSDAMFGILGASRYENTELTFEDDLIQPTFPATIAEQQISMPRLKAANITYSIINTRFYYDQSITSYVDSKSLLLNDYGLILLFDLEDWTSGITLANWNSMQILNATSTSAGTVANPALYLEDNSIISRKYYYENNFKIKCPWYECNYTSNKTAFDSDQEYMFDTINNINDLKLLSEEERPRTYINGILLFDDYNNLLAKCSLSRPIKKDYLNEYTFKLKVRR